MIIIGSCSIDNSNKTNDFQYEILESQIGFGQSCLDSISNCSPFFPIAINNVTIPQYPDCSFSIRVDICVIQDPTLGTEIFVGNYQLLNLQNCPSLLEDWSEIILDPGKQPGEINSFVNWFDALIYTRIEDYLYAEKGNVVGCNSPLGTLIISFIKSTCESMCLYNEVDILGPPLRDDTGEQKHSKGSARSDETDYYSLYKVICSTDGCCRRATTICYDPVSQQVVKTTNSTVYPLGVLPQTQCFGGIPDRPSTVKPRAGLLGCTPCTFTCQ